MNTPLRNINMNLLHNEALRVNSVVDFGDIATIVVCVSLDTSELNRVLPMSVSSYLHGKVFISCLIIEYWLLGG